MENANKETPNKWDHVYAPQFINFDVTTDEGESFFDKCLTASTPIQKRQTKKNSDNIDEDVLTTSIDNISLSNTQQEITEDTRENYTEKNQTVIQQYVVHHSSIKIQEKIKQDELDKARKKSKVTVNPFSFDLREKNKKENKQEHTNNKMLSEEKRTNIFRARPMPKFIKTHAVSTSKDTGKTKIEKINVPVQQAKKNTVEVWKKPPFVPCPSQRNVQRPNTPPLRTAVRAKERKLYDDAVKEKEKRLEEMRQMDITRKKKAEAAEIARLRKQMVHKAQPVRKFKSGLPEIQKRPLTDPMTPITVKRRRRS